MQVERPNKEVQTQKEKEALQAWANEAEKKIKELGSKIEDVCFLFESCNNRHFVFFQFLGNNYFIIIFFYDLAG